MKKIIIVLCLLTTSFCAFTQEKENISSYDDLYHDYVNLKKENDKLRSLIFEDAEIIVNGEKLQMEGLLKGYALAWTKLNHIKYKYSNAGNYAEITGLEKYNFLENEKDDLKINVILENKTDNEIEKTEENGFSAIFLVLIIFVIVTILQNLKKR